MARLGGWEDRNQKPPAADLYVYLVADTEGVPDILGVDFEAELLVYAGKPYRTVVRASMNLRTNQL